MHFCQLHTCIVANAYLHTYVQACMDTLFSYKESDLVIGSKLVGIEEILFNEISYPEKYEYCISSL